MYCFPSDTMTRCGGRRGVGGVGVDVDKGGVGVGDGGGVLLCRWFQSSSDQFQRCSSFKAEYCVIVRAVQWPADQQLDSNNYKNKSNHDKNHAVCVIFISPRSWGRWVRWSLYSHTHKNCRLRKLWRWKVNLANDISPLAKQIKPS